MLATLIAHGWPIGKALAKYLRLPRVRHAGTRMLILGDPRMTAGLLDPNVSIEQFSRLSQPVRRRSKKCLQNIEFLRLSLEKSLIHPSVGSKADAKPALRMLHKYKLAVWQGCTLEGSPDAPGPHMRRALAAYLAQRGDFFQDWIPLTLMRQDTRQTRRCSACGEITSLTRAEGRISGVFVRTLRRCPCCGVIEDMPEGSDLAMTIEGGGVRLLGRLPKRNWVITLVFQTWLTPKLDKSVAWPAASSGRPERCFRPPVPWPQGPSRALVVCLWDTSVAVMSLPMRYS